MYTESKNEGPGLPQQLLEDASVCAWYISELFPVDAWV